MLSQLAAINPIQAQLLSNPGMYGDALLQRPAVLCASEELPITLPNDHPMHGTHEHAAIYAEYAGGELFSHKKTSGHHRAVLTRCGG